MLNQFVDLLLPPASLLVVALVLLLVGRGWARRLGVAAVAVAVVLSMPTVAALLLSTLAPPAAVATGPVQAIVVLSADGIRSPEPVDLEPGLLTLDRLRAGAALARRTGLPLLVSGGEVSAAQTSLAAMMAASLRDDFRLPVKWEEDRSADTWQNAQFSAAILRPEGISRVYLVTHFWHMQRALVAFRRAGLEPIPVSVRPPFHGPFAWPELLPKPSAWFDSYLAIHEWIGLIYYRLRG